MKKVSFITCLILALAISCKPGSGNISEISNLPSFKLLLMDSLTILPTDKIQNGKPILILYFRPDCPHCQAETKSFVENIETIKKFQIYFVTNASFQETKGYQQQYQLAKYPNIIVGKDYERSFFRAFKPSSIPYLVIYDGQKRLVKVYYGEISINTIANSVS
jgi:thioredoxin-related protein